MKESLKLTVCGQSITVDLKDVEVRSRIRNNGKTHSYAVIHVNHLSATLFGKKVRLSPIIVHFGNPEAFAEELLIEGTPINSLQ